MLFVLIPLLIIFILGVIGFVFAGAWDMPKHRNDEHGDWWV